MKLSYSRHFLRCYGKAPMPIQKIFDKQAGLLLQNLRMDSPNKLHSWDRVSALGVGSASDMGSYVNFARLLQLPGASRTQSRSKTGFYTRMMLPDMEFSHTSPTSTAD